MIQNKVKNTVKNKHTKFDWYEMEIKTNKSKANNYENVNIHCFFPYSFPYDIFFFFYLILQKKFHFNLSF